MLLLFQWNLKQDAQGTGGRDCHAARDGPVTSVGADGLFMYLPASFLPKALVLLKRPFSSQENDVLRLDTPGWYSVLCLWGLVLSREKKRLVLWACSVRAPSLSGSIPRELTSILAIGSPTVPQLALSVMVLMLCIAKRSSALAPMPSPRAAEMLQTPSWAAVRQLHSQSFEHPYLV